MNFGGTLRVHPGPPFAGTFEPPGDKSITHRALLLGLMASGQTRVAHANLGADCAATLACASTLGAEVDVRGDLVVLRGRGGSLSRPAGTLDCGNSGTALRLLAGLLAGQAFEAMLDGDDSLRRRPVRRIVEPLRQMGAAVVGRDGDRYPPLSIRGGVLRGGAFELPVASAQVASCLLLAGLQAHGTTSVALPGEARDHTERMLAAFGVSVDSEVRAGRGPCVTVHGPSCPRGAEVAVPGDFSAAAFFLAAAAASPGSRVTARNVGLNPTRTALLEVLVEMGASVHRVVREEAPEPVGDVTVEGPSELQAFDVPADWLPRMVDEVPAWALAASVARGASTVSGAQELRVKESDRLAALAAGLVAVGVRAEERPDGLAITGGPVRGGSATSRGDHRLAMALSLLGLRASEPVVVDGASSIATSFPGFAEVLRGLGGRCEEEVPA